MLLKIPVQRGITLNDESWQERLRLLKRNEDWEGAVDLGLKFLPYPTAFNDVAVSLRKIIATKKKAGGDFQTELERLYRLSAYHRFVCRPSEILIAGEYDTFTYRAAKVAHDDDVLGFLDLSYAKIGYEFIDLLNTNDVRLIKNHWGEPEMHQDPRELYKHLWQDYIDRATQIAIKEDEGDDMEDEFITQNSYDYESKNKGVGFFKWLLMILIIVAAFYFLSGCATPPGQLKESDLVWQETTIAANYQEVYRNVKEGFRLCGAGVPEGDLYTDNKTAHLDVYLPQTIPGGRSDWVMGLIDIKSTDEFLTSIKAGQVARMGLKHSSQAGLWIRWASGDLACG